MSVDTVLDRSGNVRDVREVELPGVDLISVSWDEAKNAIDKLNDGSYDSFDRFTKHPSSKAIDTSFAIYCLFPESLEYIKTKENLVEITNRLVWPRGEDGQYSEMEYVTSHFSRAGMLKIMGLDKPELIPDRDEAYSKFVWLSTEKRWHHEFIDLAFGINNFYPDLIPENFLEFWGENNFGVFSKIWNRFENDFIWPPEYSLKKLALGRILFPEGFSRWMEEGHLNLKLINDKILEYKTEENLDWIQLAAYAQILNARSVTFEGNKLEIISNPPELNIEKNDLPEIKRFVA